MNRLETKRKRITRRVTRVRYDIKPKIPRPRLVINRTNRYLAVQIVDDETGKTLCSAATNEKSFSSKGKNKESAKALGELIASRASEKGVKKVVLDRRGNLYHGKIAAFAEAAREKGLEF
ncbi:MAG: 50S ribosomal protein L18 [bacterium]|nr:50S ribosomal protein L18 [bacterium]